MRTDFGATEENGLTGRSPRRGCAAAGVAIVALAVLVALAGASRMASRTAASREAARAGERAKAAGLARTSAIRITVTRDFGRTRMRQAAIRHRSGSVLTSLQRVADVETAYGGGFVNGIDGVVSGYTGGGGKRLDWFYYRNGILADVGAADMPVRSGDAIWWDYHRWDYTSSIPAVVGDFPHPFVDGQPGVVPRTLVTADSDSEKAAAVVVAALRRAGVPSVSTTDLAAIDTPPDATHLVVVAPAPALARHAWMTDAFANPQSTGLFASFTASGGVGIDGAGGTHRLAKGTGAVLATARMDRPGLGVWFVTGTDTSTVTRAAAVFAQRRRLQGRFGVLVDSAGRTSELPMAVRP
jgi:hypothetical protein